MPREHTPTQTKDERKTKGYAFPLVYDEDVERSMFFNGELKILHQQFQVFLSFISYILKTKEQFCSDLVSGHKGVSLNIFIKRNLPKFERCCIANILQKVDIFRQSAFQKVFIIRTNFKHYTFQKKLYLFEYKLVYFFNLLVSVLNCVQYKTLLFIFGKGLISFVPILALFFLIQGIFFPFTSLFLQQFFVLFITTV